MIPVFPFVNVLTDNVKGLAINHALLSCLWLAWVLFELLLPAVLPKEQNTFNLVSVVAQLVALWVPTRLASLSVSIQLAALVDTGTLHTN